MWIADTGATVHNTPHAQGIIVTKKSDGSNGVTVGNGEKMISTSIGTIHGTITDKYGNWLLNVTLKEVVHTLAAQFNLLSITKLMSDGWNVHGSNNKLMVQKGDATINFDIIIKTQRGKLFCVNMKRTNEVSCAISEISKDKAHRVLGHAGPESTVAIAKALGWKLTGTQHVCASCQMAKAKQKAVPKESTHVKATRPGKRIYLDLSKVKKPEGLKTMGKQNWFMMVDELSKLKKSSFHTIKNEITSQACKQFYKWKEQGKQVTFVRCDNAGENLSLEKTANGEKWRMNITFEFTARVTPQQNSLVETGFAYILNKSRTMMIDANVPYLQRYKIVQEAIITATKLDGLVTTNVGNKVKTRYELFGESNPSFTKHL